jgi:hypothetical protein
MTLQAKLASRAATLSRKIYASLPFEYRVARLLVQLKIASIEETYGRVFYAEFIKAGVTGMPNVGKMPVEELKDKLIRKGNQAAALLPIGYGGKFGREMWTIAKKGLGSFGSDDNVMDVMQNVVTELYAGSQKEIKAVPLATAESFVKKRVLWRAQDAQRQMKGRRDRSQSLTDTETQMQIDLMDENALKKFVQLLGPRGERTLLQELRGVDPKHPERAWEWIEAQLEGKSGREIADDWGVVPSMVTQWVTRYQGAIQDAFRKVMDIAA